MLLIFNIMCFLLFFDKILPQINSKSIRSTQNPPGQGLLSIFAGPTKNDFVCPGTGLYPDPNLKDCASYHQCVMQGIPSLGLVRCPEPYNFDTMERECRPKATANCIHCTEDGFFFDNASPYSYIQCDEGVAERVRCSPAGTIFNVDAQTCDSDPKGNFAVKGAYDKYPGVNTFGYDFHPNFSPYMESVNRKNEWNPLLSRFMPQKDIKLEVKVRAGPVNAVAKGNTKTDNETAQAHGHTFIGDEPVDKSKVLVNDSMLDERGTRGGEYSSVHAMATATGTGKAGEEVVLLEEDQMEEGGEEKGGGAAAAGGGRGRGRGTSDASGDQQAQDEDIVEHEEEDAGTQSKTKEEAAVAVAADVAVPDSIGQSGSRSLSKKSTTKKPNGKKSGGHSTTTQSSKHGTKIPMTKKATRSNRSVEVDEHHPTTKKHGPVTKKHAPAKKAKVPPTKHAKVAKKPQPPHHKKPHPTKIPVKKPTTTHSTTTFHPTESPSTTSQPSSSSSSASSEAEATTTSASSDLDDSTPSPINGRSAGRDVDNDGDAEKSEKPSSPRPVTTTPSKNNNSSTNLVTDGSDPLDEPVDPLPSKPLTRTTDTGDEIDQLEVIHGTWVDGRDHSLPLHKPMSNVLNDEIDATATERIFIMKKDGKSRIIDHDIILGNGSRNDSLNQAIKNTLTTLKAKSSGKDRYEILMNDGHMLVSKEKGAQVFRYYGPIQIVKVTSSGQRIAMGTLEEHVGEAHSSGGNGGNPPVDESVQGNFIKIIVSKIRGRRREDDDDKNNKKKLKGGTGRRVEGIEETPKDDHHGHNHGPNEKHTADCIHSVSSFAIAGEKSVNDKKSKFSEVSSMAWKGKSVPFKRVRTLEKEETVTTNDSETEQQHDEEVNIGFSGSNSHTEQSNGRLKNRNRSLNKQQRQKTKKTRKNGRKQVQTGGGGSSSTVVNSCGSSSGRVAASASSGPFAVADHESLSFDWSGGSMTSFNDSGLFPWSHSFDSSKPGDTGDPHSNFDWATGKEHEGSEHGKVPVSYEKSFGSSQSKTYKKALTENKNDKTSFKAGRSETHDGEHHYATEKKNGSSKAMKKIKSKKSEQTDSTHLDENGVEKIVSDGRAVHHENTNITEHDQHTNESRHHLHEKKLEHKNESTLHTGVDGVTRFGSLEKKHGFETLNASHIGDERHEEEMIDRKMNAKKSILSETNGTAERRLESDKTVSLDTSAKFKNLSGTETHEGKSKSLTKEMQHRLEKDGNDSRSFLVNNTYATDSMSLKKKNEYKEIALAHQKVRGSEANKAFVSINGTKKLDDYSTIIGSDTSSKTNKTGDTEVISSLQTSMIGHTDRQGEEEKNADGSIRSKFITKNDHEASQKELTVHRVDTEEGEPESETIIQKIKTKASNDESEVKKVEDLARNISQVVKTSSGNNTNSTSGSIKHNILSEAGKAREAVAARKYHKHPKTAEAVEEDDGNHDDEDENENDQSGDGGDDAKHGDHHEGNYANTRTLDSGNYHPPPPSNNNQANYANAGNQNGHHSASATGIHQQVASAGNGNIVLVLNTGHGGGGGGQTSSGGGTNLGGGGSPTHVHINAQHNFGSGQVYNSGTHNEQHVQNNNINNCPTCERGGGNRQPQRQRPGSSRGNFNGGNFNGNSNGGTLASDEGHHDEDDDHHPPPPPPKPSKVNQARKKPPARPPPPPPKKQRKTLAEKSRIYKAQEDNGAGAAGYAATGEADGEPTAYAASYSQQENTRAGGTASAGNGEVKAMAVAKRRKSKPKA